MCANNWIIGVTVETYKCRVKYIFVSKMLICAICQNSTLGNDACAVVVIHHTFLVWGGEHNNNMLPWDGGGEGELQKHVLFGIFTRFDCYKGKCT